MEERGLPQLESARSHQGEGKREKREKAVGAATRNRTRSSRGRRAWKRSDGEPGDEGTVCRRKLSCLLFSMVTLVLVGKWDRACALLVSILNIRWRAFSRAFRFLEFCISQYILYWLHTENACGGACDPHARRRTNRGNGSSGRCSVFYEASTNTVAPATDIAGTILFYCSLSRVCYPFCRSRLSVIRTPPTLLPSTRKKLIS